jgi:glycosyltransferase involved in cell wall biosynthesis
MRRQTSSTPGTESPFGVLIVSDNASAKFGGEAILPLHYFRLLRERGVKVWLVAHARTRAELSELFPGERRIRYVEESLLHTLLWRIGRLLPTQLANMTTGLALRLLVQVAERRIVRGLIASEGVDIVHQPTPVSPREPSFICDVGAPVIVGPMNGGMDYPPAFQPQQGWLEKALFRFGRSQAALLNRILPGKRRAALLLVANERTRAALPSGVCERIELMAENGVELDLWTSRRSASRSPHAGAVTFAFVGRLIPLKAVDLLLRAFAAAAEEAPMRLVVIGDGEERERLEQQAAALFASSSPGNADAPVRFTGWVTQATCARELAEVECLVMPSVCDCGGAVVLEAMAMAKPVIATAWGGALEYLDQSCGVLVPPDDPETLVEGFARAMVRLATSPAERAAMGRAGRRKIERHYDWEAKADRIIGIYHEVLQTSPAIRSPATVA